MLMNSINLLIAQYGQRTLFAFITILWKVSLLSSPTSWDDSYDYIIIGGGAAGCVLANRLSEDPSVSVLLLESGPDDNFLADVPLFQTNLRGSPLDWNYESEPNLNSNLELEGHKMRLFQGKALGGTTVINGMVHVRGSRTDYDKWHSLGVTGWSYESNLKYFIKSENNHITSVRDNSRYHGTSGNVDINSPNHKPILGKIFNFAGKLLGYRSEIDHNGLHATGFGFSQSTIHKGSRVSAARAYIHPIINRSNLKVLTFATVTKINFIGKRASGVTFYSESKEDYFKVRARKEIILSAGALATPKLLMLSGIGNCKEISKFNIPCLVNNPSVGRNLMDHIGAGSMVFLTNNTGITTSPLDITPKTAYEYFNYGTGPLTNNIIEALGFVNTENGTRATDADIELILAKSSLLSNYGFELMTSGLWSEYSSYYGKDGFSIFPVLLTPKSRGSVHLKSSDPFDDPKIYTNYLTEKDDVDTLVKGMRILLKLVFTEPFKRIGTELIPIKFSLCPNAKYLSDEYLKCALRSYTVSFWHFSGTARMGQRSDPDAVVDNKLNLIGTTGLRVVDASVMPLVTTGHLQASVYMIAEKAADIIKGKI